MPNKNITLREKAFSMRVERKSFSEIAQALDVTTKSISRWENGYTDSSGHKHQGWKPRLETEWKKLAETKLRHDLMQREECLKAIEELSRMIYNRLKEFLPTVKLRNAADAKALMSELRELIRLAALKNGEPLKALNGIVAVKADISLGEIQGRYAAAKAREAEFRAVQPACRDEECLSACGDAQAGGAGREGKANDGSDTEERSGAEGSPGVVDDN